MKHKFILLLIFSLFIACGNRSGENNELSVAATRPGRIKRYQVPSGIVEYRLTVKGNMGVGKISGNGTTKLYFKDYGALEVLDEQYKQVTEVNVFGQKQRQITQSHKMSKYDNGTAYSVDFDNRKIYKMKDMGTGLFKALKNSGNIAGSTEDMMKSAGGKKTGKEKILGYNCDIREVMGSKIWMYKGIPLKTENNMMGTTYINEAVKARFDIEVPDKYFRLPDYPVVDAGAMMNMEAGEDMQRDLENARKGPVLSYDEFKQKMLTNNPDMTGNDLKAAYKMYKMAMGK